MAVGATETEHTKLGECYSIRHNLQGSVLRFRNVEFTPDILLFGSNDLSYKENLVIFNAVHDFISQSKRFCS